MDHSSILEEHANQKMIKVEELLAIKELTAKERKEWKEYKEKIAQKAEEEKIVEYNGEKVKTREARVLEELEKMIGEKIPKVISLLRTNFNTY